jgi:hypothetical protein
MKFNIPLDKTWKFATTSYFDRISMFTLSECFSGIQAILKRSNYDCWLESQKFLVLTPRKIKVWRKKLVKNSVMSKELDSFFNEIKAAKYKYYTRLHISATRFGNETEAKHSSICMFLTQIDLAKLKSFGVQIKKPQTVEILTFGAEDCVRSVAPFGEAVRSTKKETSPEALTPRRGGLDLGV